MAVDRKDRGDVGEVRVTLRNGRCICGRGEGRRKVVGGAMQMRGSGENEIRRASIRSGSKQKVENKCATTMNQQNRHGKGVSHQSCAARTIIKRASTRRSRVEVSLESWRQICVQTAMRSLARLWLWQGLTPAGSTPPNPFGQHPIPSHRIYTLAYCCMHNPGRLLSKATKDLPKDPRTRRCMSLPTSVY